MTGFSERGAGRHDQAGSRDVMDVCEVGDSGWGEARRALRLTGGPVIHVKVTQTKPGDSHGKYCSFPRFLIRDQ